MFRALVKLRQAPYQRPIVEFNPFSRVMFRADIQHRCAVVRERILEFLEKAQVYTVLQKSNKTDFLLNMNFIIFTNQGNPLQNSYLGQPHNDGGAVPLFVAVLEGFCWNIFQLVRYAVLNIIQSTKMAPFQVVFEPGE